MDDPNDRQLLNFRGNDRRRLAGYIQWESFPSNIICATDTKVSWTPTLVPQIRLDLILPDNTATAILDRSGVHYYNVNLGCDLATAVGHTKYKLRVCNADDTSTCDTTSYIRIDTTNPAISISAPIASKIDCMLSHQIIWTVSGQISNIRIVFRKEGVDTDLVAKLGADVGSFDWSPGCTTTVNAGSIKIYDYEDTSIYGSTGVFSLQQLTGLDESDGTDPLVIGGIIAAIVLIAIICILFIRFCFCRRKDEDGDEDILAKIEAGIGVKEVEPVYVTNDQTLEDYTERKQLALGDGDDIVVEGLAKAVVDNEITVEEAVQALGEDDADMETAASAQGKARRIQSFVISVNKHREESLRSQEEAAEQEELARKAVASLKKTVSSHFPTHASNFQPELTRGVTLHVFYHKKTPVIFSRNKNKKKIEKLAQF
eukprot:TRINITY_DN9213_c0_g2_i4.p1 TRINITY_DN9213_c0_g2~~TRINITY_DN9213_c0_g2_i4.p1  ORF type:complete len:429 (+),score=131.09 TRINITY_DN9213_c0_g2_i4:98-1384(+)